MVVTVHNELNLEVTSIHWHGLLQRGTPFMDGVPYVTQCPILPHQSFEYRFQAEPVGTHWYHSHAANQRIDGLTGMIIIHPRLPVIPEMHMILQDWQHTAATGVDIQSPYAKHHRGSGHLFWAGSGLDRSADNTELSALAFTSALINGRGRYNKEEKFPLTEFRVSSGQRYRFRMVNAAAEYSFEVSVDNHDMYVVASDGQELRRRHVDAIVIHPGERYDMEVTADQPPGRYWLRANTLRRGKGLFPVEDGVVTAVNAVWAYAGVFSNADPESTRKRCSAQDQCTILNCPFAGYAENDNKQCVPLSDLQSAVNQILLDQEYGLQDDAQDVLELFYNFAMPIGSSINARKYEEARAPFSQAGISDYVTSCPEKCDDTGCTCTHVEPLPYNRTVQLVLSSYTPGEIYMAHHSAHLHGHNFALLASGYPTYNQTTGFWTEPNNDIICTGSNLYRCARRQWNGGRPSLNTVLPPVKDTVLIPARGYVVVRFRTTNPGYWFFHCHQELHVMEGMAMTFNEAPERQLPPPSNFPTCRDFRFSQHQYDDYISGRVEPQVDDYNSIRTSGPGVGTPPGSTTTTPKGGSTGCPATGNPPAYPEANGGKGEIFYHYLCMLCTE